MFTFTTYHHTFTDDDIADGDIFVPMTRTDHTLNLAFDDFWVALNDLVEDAHISSWEWNRSPITRDMIDESSWVTVHGYFPDGTWVGWSVHPKTHDDAFILWDILTSS
jgi:hypothetical protein